MTLIARPRRFGKTLNMSMLDRFFSNEYENQEELFSGLSVWEDEEYRKLAGQYPVISLSFAKVKTDNYKSAIIQIKRIFTELYGKYDYLCSSDKLTENDKKLFALTDFDMSDETAVDALNGLSLLLSKH